MDQQPIEGQALELAPNGGAPIAGIVVGGLLGTLDPMKVLEEGSKRAKALKKMIEAQPPDRKIVSKWRSKRDGTVSEHLHLPAWQFLGATLGVTTKIVATRPFDDGWEAEAEAVQLRTGQIVGAASSECLKTEDNWADQADFAVRGMAQTRAHSRAYRSVSEIGMIVVLAGYDPTPADEMTGAAIGDQPRNAAATTARTATATAAPRQESSEPISADQRREFFAALRKARIYSKRGLWEALLEWWVGESKIDRCPAHAFDRALAAVPEWERHVDEIRSIASGKLDAANDAQKERAVRVTKRLEGKV